MPKISEETPVNSGTFRPVTKSVEKVAKRSEVDDIAEIREMLNIKQRG